MEIENILTQMVGLIGESEDDSRATTSLGTWASIFAPLTPKKKRLRPYSSPLKGENERGGGNRNQSPPELGDLGGLFSEFCMARGI
jgi:hypothetical protein